MRFFVGATTALVGVFFCVIPASLAAVPTDGLVGHWKLDETSGLAVENSATSSYDGVMSGSPVWTTGKVNGALWFNGFNRVDVGYIPPVVSKPAVTLAAWMKRQNVGSPVLLGMKTTGGHAISIEAREHDNVYFTLSAGVLASAMFPMDDTEWHHFALVFDGTQAINNDRVKVYLDGELVADATYAGTFPALTPSNPGLFKIGRTLANHTLGTIDEVVLYNRALSPGEVQQLFTDDGTDPLIPDVPVIIGGGLPPEPDVMPSQIELSFSEKECATDLAVTLIYHVHDASWVRYGLTPDLSDASPWISTKDENTGSIPVQLTDDDGVQHVYVQFMSHDALRSSIEPATIRLDRRSVCGTSVPIGTQPGETQEERETTCIADLDHASLRPYLLLNDGRTIRPGTPDVIETSDSPTETQYSFDDDGDRDFSDIVLHVEQVNEKPYVHVSSFNVSLYHRIRAEILAGDVVVGDVELWQHYDNVISEWRAMDLDQYPQICASNLVSQPRPGDLIRGNETSIYYIGIDNKRHVFPDDATYNSWFADHSGVKMWPLYQIQQIPLGANVTIRPGNVAQIDNEETLVMVTRNSVIRRISALLLQSFFLGKPFVAIPLDVGFLAGYQLGKPIYILQEIERNPQSTIDEALGLSRVTP